MTYSRLLLLLPLAFVAACGVSPPKSPMEQRARLAAAAELAAQQCAGYAGGYSGAQRMKQDANENITAAREMGADDAVLAKARSDVKSTFDTASVFSSKQEACNQLVSQVAWHSN